MLNLKVHLDDDKEAGVSGSDSCLGAGQGVPPNGHASLISDCCLGVLSLHAGPGSNVVHLPGGPTRAVIYKGPEERNPSQMGYIFRYPR